MHNSLAQQFISPILLLSSVHLITNTFKLPPHGVQDNGWPLTQMTPIT